MALRFAGFELDQQRAELRGPDGEAIKLRPKTLAMLALFATNAGRVLSKKDLMDAVWPNVHVGEDSLFQCIREIRKALGDDQRQLIKLVSGLGYLFDAEVLEAQVLEAQVLEAELSEAEPSVGSATAGAQVPLPVAAPLPEEVIAPEFAPPRRRFGLRGRVAFAVVGLGAVFGLAIAATISGPARIFGDGQPTIAVLPIASDDDSAGVAANVTTGLVDGLAKIDNIRVVTSQFVVKASDGPQADFVVSGELRKSESSWEVRARMTRPATGEVVWTEPVSVAADNSELSLQQSRLTAGIGHPLALRISVLLNSHARAAATDGGSPPGSAKVVIEQATASIMQTNRERFTTAQTMLEKALAGDPDNVDIAVALAALQLRGIQMVWYSTADSAAAETNAKSILERALRVAPSNIPVLEAYCRFLNATNEFVESLVACARTLNFDPWDGMALYHIGLAQLQLGRFEDALATFKQADRFDTPQVSRWTWRLGVGLTYLLMGHSKDALPWLRESIAITPASGRSYMLLAAAYQDLGQPAEAKTAMEKALALRPGSNLSNVSLPRKNSSPVFLAASERNGQLLVAAGLPER
jgi:DNA-binding winged helix-turn-helix (wHTH) protein/Tfp pilus assembly protein PilF/TolB-like protein